MKFFSKKKYIEAEGMNSYLNNHGWIDFCDGRKVFDQKVAGTLYMVIDRWCDEVEDAPKYEIVIRSDGKITRAEMIINGKTVKKCKARCNPRDKFNFKIGAELAFERLFSKKLDLYHLAAGDKVRVRKDLIPNRVYGKDCFVDGMIPFLGKVVTISYVVAEGIYKIEEEQKWGYSFTAEMFENEKV